MGEFIGVEDPRWAEVLEAVAHDVYHLPAYANLVAAGTSARPMAYWAKEGGSQLLIPLLEQELPDGLGEKTWRDLVSPYGYASPLLVGDPELLPGLLRGFAETCAREGKVSVFLRNHPLLEPGWSDSLCWGEGGSSAGPISRGETVVVDLEQSPAAFRAQLRTDHRRGIDRLRKKGYTAVLDDWELYGSFVEIYRQTMSRVQASESYFFPERYFEALPELLASKVHLISILDPEGAVVASGLFFRHGEIIQYHLGGSDPVAMKMSPFKLSIQAAVEWGRETGARHLHLGGGLGAREDALFWFKSGFSPLRRTYSTLGVVADAAAYEELIRRSGAAADVSFFPAYRAPRQQAAERPAVAEERAGASA